MALSLDIARCGLVRALLVLCAGLALISFGAPVVWAGRPVQVYDVIVHRSDQDAGYQDAMRQALVRATGRQDAATDTAFAPLVAHAADYVRGARPVGDGLLEVSFDGAAVEHQITAAGRSVWDADRPFTLVVLSPAPTGIADDETRRELEQVAERRGLPVALVPMPVTDQNGSLLSADALLTGARRLGGDAVLLGRAAATVPNGQAAPGGQAAANEPPAPNGPAPNEPEPQSGLWQWTLITGLSARSWNGPLDAGVDGAADALARVEGSALPLTEEEAFVRVSGVGTLADYAAVERTFGELPGVRRSGLEEADGATATFRVLIRGGARAIARALAGSQHFSRVDAAGAAVDSAAGEAAGDATGVSLAYQYHP